MSLDLQWLSHRRGVVSLASVIGAVVLSAVAVPAWSALPSPVKSGHPRLFITDQRIAQIREATAPPLASTFPQERGRLSFDIVPAFAAAATNMAYTPVIDDNSELRNHLFVRHSPTEDNRANGTVALQIIVQGSTTYKGGSVNLKANELSTVVVTWDTVAKQMTISANGGTPGVAELKTPDGWRLDGQSFVLHGRPGERIDRLKVEDLATGTVVLNRGPIDMKLQDGLQQLLRPTGQFDYSVRALTGKCTNISDPSTCDDPFGYNAAVNGGLEIRHPNDVEGLAKELALAYLLTNEPRYLVAARNYAGKLLLIDPLSGSPGVVEYAMRGRVAAFSILYDWLYADMSAVLPGASSSLADQMAERVIDHVVVNWKNSDKTDCGGNCYELGVSVCGGHWSQRILRTPALQCAIEPKLNWDPVADVNLPTTATAYLGGTHNHGNAAKIAQALLAISDGARQDQVRPMLELLYRDAELGYRHAREWLSVDGGHFMSYGYTGEYNNPLMSQRLWQSALEDVPGTPVMEAAWQYKTWLPYLYAVRGNYTYPENGDGSNGTSGTSALATTDFVLTAIDGGDGYAQTFYDQTLVPMMRLNQLDFNGDTQPVYLWNRVLFGDASAASLPVSDLPLARHFRNAGVVVMRDRWSFSDATLLNFKSTSFSGGTHHHFDENSFSLFYKSPLLLDSGANDGNGSNHWANYYRRTVAGNNLVVPDSTECFPGPVVNNAPTCLSSDGGQWLQPGMDYLPTLTQAQSGANHLAGVEAFAQGADYSYVRANASRAYASAKLDQSSGYVRHIAMLRTPSFWKLPVVVMFDQVKLQTGRETLKPTVLFHTTNEPLPVGESAHGGGVFNVKLAKGARRIFDVVNGAGRLFLETLLPANPVVRKLGGVGPTGDFRFAVATLAADGSFPLVNYPPNLPSAQISGPDVGAWRVEVAAGGSATTREFLHVMSVADVGDSAAAEAPTAKNLATSANSAAVLLGGSTVVMMFNGTASTPVFFELPAGVQAGDLLVTGLQAGERFTAVTKALASGATRVTLKRDAAGSLQASDEGALRVTGL